MKRALHLSLLIVAVASVFGLPYSHANAPACELPNSDSDNDGWGWENDRSCLVVDDSASAISEDDIEAAPSEPEVATPPISATDSDTSTSPACSSADVDSDGDGWGWENNASCLVTVTTQSANRSDPVAEAIPPQAAEEPIAESDSESTESNAELSEIIDGLYRGRVPVCSSPNSDIDGDGWGFEFHTSCKVVEGYIAPDAIPDIAPKGNSSQQEVGVVYEQDFNIAETGLYQADQLNSEWQSPHWHLGFDQGRVSIVDTGGRHGNAMQVTYPAGRYGAAGATAFLSDVQFGMLLPKSYEELYIAYDIRFEEGFDFVKGGKLPGLCGYDVNQASNTGCNTGGGYPSGYDGWSARGMWREDGILENYVYHASQRNFYGDDEFWDVSAEPGVWHRVQHRVVLNTPGQKNGILEAWFDGTKVLSLQNLEYRKTNTIGINLFYFSTFFGGNDASWAPSTDQVMNFDNFVLSTSLIE